MNKMMNDNRIRSCSVPRFGRLPRAMISEGPHDDLSASVLGRSDEGGVEWPGFTSAGASGPSARDGISMGHRGSLAASLRCRVCTILPWSTRGWCAMYDPAPRAMIRSLRGALSRPRRHAWLPRERSLHPCGCPEGIAIRNRCGFVRRRADRESPLCGPGAFRSLACNGRGSASARSPSLPAPRRGTAAGYPSAYSLHRKFLVSIAIDAAVSPYPSSSRSRSRCCPALVAISHVIRLDPRSTGRDTGAPPTYSVSQLPACRCAHLPPVLPPSEGVL